MTTATELHQKWLGNQDYRAEYDALDEEFALAQAIIEARLSSGLTQEELADRMQTKQSVVARLESGRAKPSTQTLERVARATGTHLRISFEAV